MPYRVFVSYSTKDLDLVNSLREVLRVKGVEVFIAQYSLIPGADLDEGIVTAIKGCDLFVVLWSKDSEASRYVPAEVGMAKITGKAILPVLLSAELKPPAFTERLKYFPAWAAPAEAVKWLRGVVIDRATKKDRAETVALLVGAGLLVVLLSGDG